MTAAAVTIVVCRRCGTKCAGPAGLADHTRDEHPTARAPLAAIGEAPPADVDSDDDELVWEEPPKKRTGHGRPTVEVVYKAKLDQLRAHPSKWARIATLGRPSSASSLGGRLRKRAPGFQFRAARVEGGGSSLWARFLGEG